MFVLNLKARFPYCLQPTEICDLLLSVSSAFLLEKKLLSNRIEAELFHCISTFIHLLTSFRIMHRIITSQGLTVHGILVTVTGVV